MITDIFLFIVWIILIVFHAILSVIPISLPADVGNSVYFFASYLVYTKGIIDPRVWGALEFLLNFMVGFFTVKLLFLFYHMTRGKTSVNQQQQ